MSTTTTSSDSSLDSSQNTVALTASDLVSLVETHADPGATADELADAQGISYEAMYRHLNTLASDGRIKRVLTTDYRVQFAPNGTDMSAYDIKHSDIPKSFQPDFPRNVRTGILNSEVFSGRVTNYESYWWCKDLTKFFGELQREHADTSTSDDPKAPITHAYLAAKNAKNYWGKKCRDSPGTFAQYRTQFSTPAFDYTKLDQSSLSDYGLSLDADAVPLFIPSKITIPPLTLENTTEEWGGVNLPDGTHDETPDTTTATDPADNSDNDSDSGSDGDSDTGSSVNVGIDFDISITIDAPEGIDEDDINVSIE